jgi:hypothetical protein
MSEQKSPPTIQQPSAALETSLGPIGTRAAVPQSPPSTLCQFSRSGLRDFETVAEKSRYEERVDDLFRKGIWPDVEGIVGGIIMYGCWTKELKTAEAIMCAQEKNFPTILDKGDLTN